MTSPATSQDVPLAQVSTVGISEALQILALVASLLTALFGHDFGITKNAQAIAQAAVILIPMGMAFARSIKHKGIAHANAIVTAAQIEATVRALIAAQQPGSAAAGATTAAVTQTTTPPATPDGPAGSEVTMTYDPTTVGADSTSTITYAGSQASPAQPGVEVPADVDLSDIPQDLS